MAISKRDNVDGGSDIPDGGAIDLRNRGINEAQAADLLTRLGAIRDDWNRPEMDVYDEPELPTEQRDGQI